MAREPMSDEAPLGTFEEQVMLSVMHAEPDSFGMHVRREIEERTGREVAIGAVYATLDRLEAKGLIASSRVRGSGASRRVFQVSSKGVTALAQTRVMRDQLWEGINLGRFPSPKRA
jgi:PadR family transcriptional regulator PadR